jgi:hypothetical protein
MRAGPRFSGAKWFSNQSINTESFMEDELSFEAFGIEFGMRMFRSVSAPQAANQQIAQQLLEQSVGQAVHIFTSLGIAHRVNEAMFGRMVGFLVGSNSAFIAEVTGQPIPMTDDAVPNADRICVRAFNAMKG